MVISEIFRTFLNYINPLNFVFSRHYFFYYKLYLLSILVYLLAAGSIIIYSYKDRINRQVFKKILRNSFIIIILFLIFYSDNHLNFFTDDMARFNAAKDFIILNKEFEPDIITYTYSFIFYITSSFAEETIVFFSYLLLAIAILFQLKIILKIFKNKIYAYIIFITIVALHLFLDEFKYNSVNYMFYSYFLNTLILYLIINFYNNKSFNKIIFIIPPLMMLAMLYRQENIVLLPFLIIIYFLNEGPSFRKNLLITILFIIVFIPVLSAQYKDEVFLNKKLYTHNIIDYLQSADAFSEGLLRKIEDAGNPSIKNYYNNLKYRSSFFKIIFLMYLFSISAIIFLKKYRERAILILIIFSVLSFLLIFSQKFSVGHFKRFYPYLIFPYITIIFYSLNSVWLKIKRHNELIK